MEAIRHQSSFGILGMIHPLLTCGQLVMHPLLTCGQLVIHPLLACGQLGIHPLLMCGQLVPHPLLMCWQIKSDLSTFNMWEISVPTCKIKSYIFSKCLTFTPSPR